MSFQYRELRAFDPSTRLVVDETFRLGNTPTDDPLGDLLTPPTRPGEEPGTVFQDFRTKGSITAGITPIPSPSGEEYLLVLNHKGEVILFRIQSGKLEVCWNVSVRGAFYRSAVLVDEHVFFVTKQGFLTGIRLVWDENRNPKPPETVWQRALNQTIFSTPITTGKVLILATMNALHAYDCYSGGPGETGKLGKKFWEEPIPGSVASPAFGKGKIYIGCEDKHVYAYTYSTDNLSHAWKCKTDGSIRTQPYVTQKGNFLLVGSMDGILYALEPNTGKVVWSFPSRAAIHSEMTSFLDGNDEYFLFGNDAGVVYCLNLYGKMQWKYSTNGRMRSPFLVHGDAVYFGSEDNSLYGLHKTTGKLLMKYSTDGNINGLPFISGNRIFVGSTDCFVHGIFI